MSDGVAVFVFQNLYEPVQDGNKWVVNYKWQGEWKKEICDTREEAVKAHQKKTNQLRDYYNKFLRELRVRK